MFGHLLIAIAIASTAAVIVGFCGLCWSKMFMVYCVVGMAEFLFSSLLFEDIETA